MTKLLVASGVDYLTSVEVVNLDETYPDLICNNLQDLPQGIQGATGQLFQGSRPIICGGIKAERYVDACDCFELKSGRWVPIASLSECRQYAPSLNLLFQNEEWLIITGGTDTSSELKNSVEAFDGNSWSLEKVSPLPISISGHCMVRVNESTLLSIGGFENNTGYSNNTYFYYSNSNSWNEGPKLNVQRTGAVCGLFNWVNRDTNQNERVVVVAGGFNNEVQYMSSVELLFLEEFESTQDGWEMGPNLPRATGYSTMTEYNNSVILVGGLSNKYLYQLSSPDGTWVEMKQTLKERRAAHVAFLVPDDIVNCF